MSDAFSHRPTPADGPGPDGARPARLLAVEDSATQAAALAVLLEDAGYEVVVARSGERALDLVTRDQFDLVLSDVVMPGINGYELCRRIKEDLGHADLPVVLLTSLSDPLDIVRGLEAGADNYVTKPYEPGRLLARIASVLATAAGPRVSVRGRPVKVTFEGVTFTISADKEQIVELLVSSYEDLVRTSEAVRSAEQRARFLADAGELLSASLDADVVLRDLARLVVPTVADLCAVDVPGEDGQPRRAALVPSNVPPHEPGDARPALAAGALSAGVLRTGEPELVPEVTEEVLAQAGDADAALLRGHDVRSYMVVPLVARGGVLGALLLAVGGSGRRFGEDDLVLATDLARRAALAVDNARLYRDAQLATRARDDVLAIVSHDLRNPIHTIQMSASLLLEVLPAGGGSAPGTALGTATDAAAPLEVQQLAVIRRAAGRANALIQDLLDVTRIDAGTLAVRVIPYDAATLLAECVSEMAPLTGEKDVALTHQWSGAPARVCADRERIAQVFSNLVGNALKFTPTGGRIAVTGEVRAGAAWFSVRDTGAGIPADHLPHLFDRFWQANRTTRAGAGLGLSITKGIIEAHHGQITVESTPGVGSTFGFSLPLDLRESGAAATDTPLGS